MGLCHHRYQTVLYRLNHVFCLGWHDMTPMGWRQQWQTDMAKRLLEVFIKAALQAPAAVSILLAKPPTVMFPALSYSCRTMGTTNE